VIVIVRMTRALLVTLAILVVPGLAHAARTPSVPPIEGAWLVAKDGRTLAVLQLHPDVGRGFHREAIVLRDLRTGRTERDIDVVAPGTLAAQRRAGEFEIYRADLARGRARIEAALRGQGYESPRRLGVVRFEKESLIQVDEKRKLILNIMNHGGGSELRGRLDGGEALRTLARMDVARFKPERGPVVSMPVSALTSASLLPGGRLALEVSTAQPPHPEWLPARRLVVVDLRPLLETDAAEAF